MDRVSQGVAATPDVTAWYATPLAGAVLGATIALLGSLFVQGWLVPRIEARKRREQQWETDLRDLGEAISSDALGSAAAAARWGGDWWLTLRDEEQPSDMTATRWRHLRTLAKEKATTAQSEYDDLAASRVRWLVSRVVALAPASPELQALRWEASRFDMASMFTRDWLYKATATVEEHHATWDKEKERRSTLTASVIALLDAKRLPRVTMRRRMRVRVRRLVPRWSAWRATRRDDKAQPPRTGPHQ